MKTWIGASVLLGLLVLLAIVVLFQRRFFYFPRKYTANEVKAAEDQGVAPLRFETPQGKQTAFLLRTPRSERPPSRLWILFGGNAMTALDWLVILNGFQSDSIVFLLVDYPGYGLCNGLTTADSISESAVTAYRALIGQAGWTEANPAIGVLGWSLGAAAALQFAERQRVEDLVLISPFTSMQDMVRKVVGLPPGMLLLDRFDNIAALTQVCAGTSAPRVTIIHGYKDALIPVRMGERLASLAPNLIDFHSIPGASHHSVFSEARKLIYSKLRRHD